MTFRRWTGARLGTAGTAKQALDEIYTALLSPDAQANGTVVSEMLRQLELVTQSRRARLVAAEGAVPNVIWLALLGGAMVAIGFTFFFGAEHLRSQVAMTAMLAVLIFSELLIIIVIDRPFTGVVMPKCLPMSGLGLTALHLRSCVSRNKLPNHLRVQCRILRLAVRRKLLAEYSPAILLTHLVGDARPR